MVYSYVNLDSITLSDLFAILFTVYVSLALLSGMLRISKQLEEKTRVSQVYYQRILCIRVWDVIFMYVEYGCVSSQTINDLIKFLYTLAFLQKLSVFNTI